MEIIKLIFSVFIGFLLGIIVREIVDRQEGGKDE